MKKTVSSVVALLFVPMIAVAAPSDSYSSMNNIYEEQQVLVAKASTKISEDEQYLLSIEDDKPMVGPKDFSGGVASEHQNENDYDYEEYVFLTGEPIKFSGKLTSTEKKDSVTYKFKLESEDGGKLTRTVTYDKEITPYGKINQLVETMNVSKVKEDIEIGDYKFKLDNYQLNKSEVIDKRPASDFSNGNIKGKKHYIINNNEGKATVEMTGGNVGYQNFWGGTGTQIMDNIINVEMFKKKDDNNNNNNDDDKEEMRSWSGTYSFQTSESEVTSLRYSENDANLSSISGGHLKVQNKSSVSEYSYDLDGKDRERGRVRLSKSDTPKLERLVVPKFRDVNGHWAEDSIKKLYSVAVYEDGREEIFSPDTNMNRMEFTVAMMKASDIRPETEDEKNSRRSSRSKKNKVVEISPFRDISVDDENYQYIKNGIDKGIVRGYNKDDFGPDRPLTRAEAITMMIRALGFENKAPNPGYMTSFSDDGSIPNWAKDSIYMAKEIGLISGDNNNRVNPNKSLSRAEASVLVVKYLEFLEKDLQKDYRYNIVNFR